MSDIELVIDGQAHRGWKTVSVTRSLEQLAHTWSLTLTDRWLSAGEPSPIAVGARARIEFKGAPLVDGWIDDRDDSADRAEVASSVEGRSRTGDLVDCPAQHKTGAWKNATLLTIAKDLCSPYDIGCSVEGDTGATFKRFALQDGETVHAALERAARMRGYMVCTDTRGDVVFVRTGSTRIQTAIEWGVNVLSGSRRESWRERFSHYTLKAQISGDDDFFGASAAYVKAEATDSGVQRHRPCVTVSGTQESKSGLQVRADWERNVRRGRSVRLQYTVVGWEHADGLWTPNTIVPVRDERFDVHADLLLVSTRMLRDSSGTRTELELMAPAAFAVEPPQPIKSKGNGFTLL